MVLVLPSANSGLNINLNDVVIIKALDEVRVRCQVWIDCVGNENYLVISGRKDQHIQNGLHEVREWVIAQSKELKANAVTFVHRIGTNSRFGITLKPTQDLGLGSSITDGWRGVALIVGVTAEESHLTLPGSLEALHPNGQLETYNDIVITKQLLNAIHQAARLMRPDLGRKYVRVHLGIRALSKRETKDHSRVYSTSQFRDLASTLTKRGDVSFRLW